MVDSEEVYWAQCLLVSIQDSQDLPDKLWFDLSWIHKHQLKFKSHRVHQLSGDCPVWGNASSEQAHHLEDLFDAWMRFDLLTQVDDVLLRKLSDAHVCHLDSIVELFFSQFHLELFLHLSLVLLINCGRSIVALRMSLQSELLCDVWIVKEVVLSEYTTGSCLLTSLLLRNDVSGVHLGRDINAVVDVAGAVASSLNLTFLSIRISF